MDIKPIDKTIKELLKSGRQFVIPRFQRDYSWDKKHYEEFLNDIISGLRYSDSSVSTTPYFLGTMLFIGNFNEKGGNEIQVVDGQQRITTITILFSALSDIFQKENEIVLSKRIFDYIMTEDDDGKEIRIIKSDSSYPYFAYFIQDINKEDKSDPSSEEEVCIQNTYNYFRSRLEYKKLKDYIQNNCNGFDDSISYIDLLKAIRDQILNCIFVSISTEDKEQATRIFEILNAKGKKLAAIDLIKNRIFEEMSNTEPVDIASVKWKELKDLINECDVNSVGIGTYFRHFWNSCYGQAGENSLYDKFQKNIQKKEFRTFLESLVQNAKYYVQIIKPKREDYGNRKEYFWLVQSLNVLTNYFGIAQARVVLMALMYAKDKGTISSKDFKKAVLFLENFHFAYTAVMSGKANKLDSAYSKVAIEIRKSTNKVITSRILNTKLYAYLNSLIPQKEQFVEKFIEFSYSKKSTPSNLKCKYALNKLNCYYQNKEIFEDDSSIEHILPEANKGESNNIGNLIIIEESINNEVDSIPFGEKKKIYQKSNYKWVKAFLDKYDEWNETMIIERAKMLASIFYDKILEF